MKHRRRVRDSKRNNGRTILEAKYTVKPYGEEKIAKQRGAQNTNTDCLYESIKFLKDSIYIFTTFVEPVPLVHTTSPNLGDILRVKMKRIVPLSPRLFASVRKCMRGFM